MLSAEALTVRIDVRVRELMVLAAATAVAWRHRYDPSGEPTQAVLDELDEAAQAIAARMLERQLH